MKCIYNLDYLNKYCIENNVILTKDYTNEKLNREAIIEGKCCFNNCNKLFFKKFLHIAKYGAFCKDCTKINRNITYKKTCIKKYGVENMFQLDNIKEKIIQTNLTKYGVINPTYSNEIKEKTKQKNVKKYGVEFPSQLQEVIVKKQDTMIKKYGVKYPLQSEICQNKFKQTCLKKYGFENPHQNAEFSEKTSKNSYLKKTYTSPSGKQFICQGYEHFALDCLITKENINENEIITCRKNVPTIWYNDNNGKKHRHYVDIFIPSQNKCIEVKSTWTFKKKKDCVFLKQNAAKELGYIYEIWVYSSKGEIVEKHI